MDPGTIKEARRLLHDLIYTGAATTKGGRVIKPMDEALVSLIKQVSEKKLEEPDVLLTVEGYTPKETHLERSPKEGNQPVPPPQVC